MRRLARHLLTLCSAVSLVLCVSATGLWACSYVADVDVRSPDSGAEAERGRLMAWGNYATGDPLVREDWEANRGGLSSYPALPHRAWSLGRFAFTLGQARRLEAADRGRPRPVSYWRVDVPLWAAVLVTAVLPLLAFRRIHADRRTRARFRRRQCPS